MTDRIERDFKAFAPSWPTYLSDSEDAARKEWKLLDDTQRERAVVEAERFCEAVKASGKNVCSLAVYLRELRWLKLPRAQTKQDVCLPLAPFGKAWMAHRLRLLKEPRIRWKPSPVMEKLIAEGKGHMFKDSRRRGEFPRVAEMDDLAVQNKPSPPPQNPDLASGGYVTVHVGSPEWEAWQGWFEANDYPPLPTPPGKDRYVWIPKEPPSDFTPMTSSMSDEDIYTVGQNAFG